MRRHQGEVKIKNVKSKWD